MEMKNNSKIFFCQWLWFSWSLGSKIQCIAFGLIRKWSFDVNFEHLVMGLDTFFTVHATKNVFLKRFDL